jgi:aspartate-semialdehyde dehydrogenase
MAGRMLRGAIVGAASLLGKELAEELKDTKGVEWDLTLLDAGDIGGQITSAGDEALMIQAVSADAFKGIDVVFFAGDAAETRQYWAAAQAAGASIVDLTAALEGLPGALLRSSWMEGAGPDLATTAVVAAHPMAALLALLEVRLRPLGLKRLAATVLLPASEMGSAGVDELQQQTVGLLTFQTLPKGVYDAQVAFNVAASLGGAAKLDLVAVRTLIARQAAILTGEASVLAVQAVQAPVFHGFAASVFVELQEGIVHEAVAKALRGGILQVVAAEEDEPSNASVAGDSEATLSVRAAGATADGTFWVWLTVDNLRLAVGNAAGCARELAALRPVSGVH